jgi:8-oxo-dGTP pyrophosphatase MutT (NUDIX family)
MIAGSILADIRTRLERALARPAGSYRPLTVDGDVVGWLDAARAARLARFAGIFVAGADGLRFADALSTPAARTAALDGVARTLAAEGALSAWRDERYAAASGLHAPPRFLLERCAARYFGIRTWAVHVNGLVVGGGDGDGEPDMWIARRSPTKAIDPGMLDNLVGGGIAAGADAARTVVKEAWEEAGIPAPLARRARPAGAVHICREQPDGLHRETIFVHDLVLPADFTPVGQDGEVVEERRVSLAKAARLVANASGPDVVTADASLVIVDCLLRHGAIAPDAPDYLALEALRHPDLDVARR